MRITEVLLQPTIGGAETLVAGLARRWSAAGDEVETIYLDPPGAPTGRAARLRRLSRALERIAPDVVHAHSALPNIYARLAARGRWPTVTVLHGAGANFDVPSLSAAERLLARWTGHVVAVSADQVAEYRARFGGSTPVTLIPNGVREDLVTRSEPSPRLAIAASLCRLEPQKRIDVLTAGWAGADLDGAELLIAGSARDDETHRQAAAWIAACPNARALGDVGDVPDLLSRTDLLVHAADVEAHPLAPLEAAVAGVPVIMSDRVAATVPDVPAAVFRAGDPHDLADVIRRVAADHARVSRIALEAAPVLRARFSLAASADGHRRVLEDVVARHPARGCPERRVHRAHRS
ncbi:glycosyltransferase family 4 protein [Actinomycetospora lutea]|uniref:glycosyltransferase family 4 protein n=1 Tax=Actinomycetospora lutea TaxID=663604 RepID=UPI002365D6ED|nr:glycosyltransferase family 4 protein [Actinomycetospora lutea]MDD7942858.1 glycosyltransferase family 4 protein [Actinomycetospora lutea]